MKDEAEARLGTRIGNYALKEIIGRGGMGVVYRASHIYIRRSVAVKILHRHLFREPGVKARFLDEAQTASLVTHPNIIGVTDFGEAPDGTVYLVMAEVDGIGLDVVIEKEGTLPLFRTIEILGQVVQALGAVHARGIIHSDVKPENIMLARRIGKRQIVRRLRDGQRYLDVVEPEECFDAVTLLDFGAARFMHGDQRRCDPPRLFGTPAYIAPETAMYGLGDVRSDVYAVGILFYEMLTGQVPFEGDTDATLRMQISEPVEPPRKRNPYVEITAEAERVVMRALEKDPSRRQATMDVLWSELQGCYGCMRWHRPEVAVAQELAPPLLLTKKKRKAGSLSPEDVPTPPPVAAASLGGLGKDR